MSLENDPFSQSVPVGIAARMAQLNTQQLRRFHERGWLVPSEVDPDTGRRHYTREDVDTARLLSALLRTGMKVSDAGPAVANGNRQALLDHLTCAADGMEEIRRLLPPERPGWVRPVMWAMETRLIFSVDLPPGAPLDRVLQEVAACQARAAAARGVGADRLPRAARPDAVPVGPSVQYTTAPYAPTAIHLPWDDEPAIDGALVKACSAVTASSAVSETTWPGKTPFAWSMTKRSAEEPCLSCGSSCCRPTWRTPTCRSGCSPDG